MAEHRQGQPPDYHRCAETVLASPSACHYLLTRLAEMTDAEANSPWSPWRGEAPPPHGEVVNEMVPAEVRLVALRTAYDNYVATSHEIWQRLYDVLDIPPMQQSAVELIETVRHTIADLRTRIADLEHDRPS